jgi:hypothetical protein
VQWTWNQDRLARDTEQFLWYYRQHDTAKARIFEGTSNDYIDMTTLGGRVKHTQLAAAAEIGRSNPGTVTATPDGADRQLNCGGACSAKFIQGTTITLTAIPPAGKMFVNWSNACLGTALTCTITINGNTTVQAVFSK